MGDENGDRPERKNILSQQLYARVKWESEEQ